MSTMALNGRLNRVGVFYSSVTGKQIVMAVTGFVLFGYVLVHMLGNLQIFLPPGPDGIPRLDHYAQQLRAVPPLLWGARVVLLAAVVLHIVTASQLTVLDKFRTRHPSRYVKYKPIASNYASRTMFWSGLIIFFYVIYHLLDLTFGTVNPHFEEAKVYHNVVASFQNPVVALFYIVANIVLAMHLYHGIWSIFQHLGVSHPWYNALLKKASVVFAIGIGVGFCAVPLAVMTGLVK